MDNLNNLPKIYAHCPAGCKWETIHRSEFANAATYTPVYPNESGLYRLELGKEYKIFAPSLADCFIMINTFGIDCNVDDEYAEFVVFKLLAVSETFIVYELAGERIKENIDIASVPEYCELYGASRVYQYNADASILGKEGKSAYEIACENGFEGTEEEWLVSLKGDKGDKGDVGSVNVLGTMGDSETDAMSQKTTTREIYNLRDSIMSGKDIVKDIDLTKYTPINFYLGYVTTWVPSSVYKSVLIPVEHFYDTIRINSVSYGAQIAFLKDDYVEANEEAHFCESEAKIFATVGQILCRSIPDDCKFICVYISDGSILSKFSITTAMVSIPYVGGRLVDDVELDLSIYGQEYYNLENGVSWASNTYYRCVLIPTNILTRYIKLYSKEYKCSYALLRDNIINNGESPNLCSNEKITTLKVGEEKTIEIPSDCKYIYVYISDSTYFGKFGLVRFSEKTQTDIMYDKIEGGKVFINDTEQMLLTLKHMHTGSDAGFVAGNTSDNLLTMIHTSDVHTDITSYSRFIGFANDNEGHIDCAIVSGDLVDYMGVDEPTTRMIQCESELSESIPLLKCMGNHERNNTIALADIYTIYNMDTPTGKLYYYKDFADKKIRVICLNQYDVDGIDGLSASLNIRYSQEQINWFISALKDAATNGYAVVVVYHSCEEVGFPTHNYSGFCQELNYDMPKLTTKPIISDIINAFQNGVTLNDTYTIADTTVTVSADFTSKGIFVCYLCGHQHVDYIGYSKVYPNQLICMVQGGVVNSAVRTEAQSHWQSRYDTPRVEGTSTADSINVYSIDTTNRLLKVVKIGSTMTDKFVPRTFATFGF